MQRTARLTITLHPEQQDSAEAQRNKPGDTLRPGQPGIAAQPGISRRPGHSIQTDFKRPSTIASIKHALIAKRLSSTLKVTGLRPATLDSKFEQQPQLRVHRFVSWLPSRPAVFLCRLQRKECTEVVLRCNRQGVQRAIAEIPGPDLVLGECAAQQLRIGPRGHMPLRGPEARATTAIQQVHSRVMHVELRGGRRARS